MELIQNSKDLLYVSASFSLFLVSIFIAWLIFYIAMIAKEFYDIIKGVRNTIDKVDEAIIAFKEKIEHSASYLLLIGEGMKKLVDLAKGYAYRKKERENEGDKVETKAKSKKKT